MVGESFSHYVITGVLGEGAMGVVYRARDSLLDREVAIKFPRSEGTTGRILAEARSASALNHPHIAIIHDTGEYRGQVYIVMELIEGVSLRQMLARGPLSVEKARELGAQVADAIAAAHELGIIHRDIKPSNIHITHRGFVKVVDFGIARRVRERARITTGGGLTTTTMEATIEGTPGYMAPEQARGQAPDAQSDLFSLGAVLYECLAGRPAFSGSTAMDVIADTLRSDPPPPSRHNPAVPRDLDSVVLMLLEKDRSQRPASAATVANALRAGVALPGARKPPRAYGRRTLFIAAAMCAAAILGAGVWSYSTRPYRPSPEARRWYEEGSNAIRDGSYFKASNALELAVQKDGNFRPARARLAEALGELDYTSRARDELLRAMSPDMTGRLTRNDRLLLEAIHATLTGDYATSVKKYQELLEATGTAERASVLVDLGRAYERSDKGKEALESYREAARLQPQYAAPFLRLGVMYGRQQDSAASEKAFDQAEALYRASSNVEGLAEVEFQRGMLASRINNLTEAQARLEESMRIARGAGNPYQQVTIQFNLSAVAVKQARVAEAERMATEALELARAKGLEGLTSRGLIDVGNALFLKGDGANAERYYSQALENARRFRTLRTEARALASLGSLHIHQQKTDLGISEVEQGMARYRQGGYYKETAQAAILLGRARRNRGDYEGARKAFEEQLEAASRLGEAETIGLAHEGLGSIALLQDRFGDAFRHFDLRCTSARNRGMSLQLAYGLVNRATALILLGRLSEAERTLREVRDMVTRGRLANIEKHLVVTEASLALAHRNYSGARNLLGPLIKEADPEVALEAQRQFALASAYAGNRGEALRAMERALSLARKRGNEHALRDTILMQAEVLAAAGQPGPALEAAVHAEQSAARANCLEARWRALALAARAAGAAGDARASDFANQALEALRRLEGSWDTADFSTYSTRRDVRDLRSGLDRLAAARRG
jgi:tetratricopeptide (TPR) repeat protein/tRNA A-37 threonylcarbamoyl transferase component Bud32